jgi:hypothetical protein
MMTLHAVTAGSDVGNRTVEFVVMAATAAASRMVAGFGDAGPPPRSTAGVSQVSGAGTASPGWAF